MYDVNACTGVYEDMVKAGVIGPNKVTCTALQYASSISAWMLTAEAMICGIPEKEAPQGVSEHGVRTDY